MNTNTQSFAPKILVVGRRNTVRSVMIEALLRDDGTRFGLLSAGISPADESDNKTLTVLEEHNISVKDPKPLPLSAGLDNHIKHVIYVSDEVKNEGPIIAIPGEKTTLEIPSIERSASTTEPGLDDYRTLFTTIRDNSFQRVLTVFDKLNG